MDETREYEWTDNPTISGESDCNTDVLNECLMHLKYNNSSGGGSTMPLFTMMAFDRILTGDESIGWALQGSLITNTYPDAVAQIKDEYTNAQETLNYNKTTPIALPVFTSNTTNGITVSDSRGNANAYTLINGVSLFDTGAWDTYWFNIDYGQKTIIKSYVIKADSSGDPEYPSNWTLQASNDGSQWDILDTRSGQTFTSGQSRTFIVTTDTAYQQYRLVFSDGVEVSGHGELGQLGFNVGSIIYSFDYKKAQNGHLIADISYKSQIDALFNEKGIADYYILDSINNQFYLPRTKWFHQFTVDANLVNIINDPGLPNIKSTGHSNIHVDSNAGGAFVANSNPIPGWNGNVNGYNLSFDASQYNPIYSDEVDTVQPPSSNKLLYYKVGSTIVNESEIDVENLINDVQGVQIEIENKVNTDLSNCTKPYITNTYSNGASWYRVYSDGWCEQGGQIANGGNNVTVALLKPYVNTNYLAIGCAITSNNGKVGYASVGIKTTTTCSFINQSYAYPVGWKTEGYIF